MLPKAPPSSEYGDCSVIVRLLFLGLMVIKVSYRRFLGLILL